MASFSDDFNRSDSTDLGVDWVEVSGDWAIASGQLTPDTSGGTTILRATAAMASSDHFAQFTITATTTASQGVWCRGNTNITSGYLWRTSGSSWDLFSVVSGSFAMIGSYVAPVAPGDVAKVQAVGSTIKGYVNGIERVSVANADVVTGVNVGLRVMAVGGLRFDDFAAADVTAGTILDTASSIETAQALTATKTAALSTATEVGSAPPLTGAKAATLTPAIEQDAAQILTGAKTGTLTAAEAIEAAQPLTPAAAATLPTASTIETARPLTGTKTATLTPALEVSTVCPLSRQTTVTPSPERTLTIHAENRRLTVAAENRTLTVRQA